MVSSVRDTLKRRSARAAVGIALALAFTAVCAGCAEPEAPPNVLWIVWDTVRADRLGLYGAERPTTPHLDRFAEGARVFEDCLAVGATTVPNHASMFTGLLPSEHGASNAESRLDDAHETIAERLSAAGYRTYLWSANPHIGRRTNFTRGFDRWNHPWDAYHQRGALEMARSKIEEGDGSGLADDLGLPRVSVWAMKESGALPQRALLEWLKAQPADAPWFAFVNYMEAHRPVVPARRFREQVMDADRVARSYQLDRDWDRVWNYTLGLAEFEPEELAVIAGTYDAAIAELDALFAELLAALEERGELEHTVVILSSDHGEQLGEHHMLDHQYSLYEPVLRVPLVIHYPERFAPGREKRPVMNFDLFPTLLELAGLGLPEAPDLHAVSLLSPRAERTRLAEYRSVFAAPFRGQRERAPGFDPSPWQRRLRALVRGDEKLIWAEDGRHELYDLASDPREERDLHASQPERARAMHEALDAFVASLAGEGEGRAADFTPGDRKRLEALGYGEGSPGPADGP